MTNLRSPQKNLCRQDTDTFALVRRDVGGFDVDLVLYLVASRLITAHPLFHDEFRWVNVVLATEMRSCSATPISLLWVSQFCSVLVGRND